MCEDEKRCRICEDEKNEKCRICEDMKYVILKKDEKCKICKVFWNLWRWQQMQRCGRCEVCKDEKRWKDLEYVAMKKDVRMKKTEKM